MQNLNQFRASEENFTVHAESRIRQRGIGLVELGILETFGVEQHDHRGCVRLWLNKKARQKIQAALGKKAAQLKLNNLYAVTALDNGSVITAGHRNARFYV